MRVAEPIVTFEEGVDPEYEALLADSVGLAMLVVLEKLAPAERLAFVLRSSTRTSCCTATAAAVSRHTRSRSAGLLRSPVGR